MMGHSPQRLQDTPEFWRNASTALVIIGQGRGNYRVLMEALDMPRSTLFYFIDRLIELGLARQEYGKQGTLHLTELGQNSVQLVQLAREAGNGTDQFLTRWPGPHPDGPPPGPENLHNQQRGV